VRQAAPDNFRTGMQAPEGQEASDDTKLKVRCTQQIFGFKDNRCQEDPGQYVIIACNQTILGKDIDFATLAALKAWKRGEA
jgi:hypothetical protein